MDAVTFFCLTSCLTVYAILGVAAVLDKMIVWWLKS